jgi:flagellar motor switch protein FliM
MALLIPYAAIAPVASAFSRHDEEVKVRDEVVAAAVNEGLSHVEVSMRAEVADTHITLGEILKLQPGDVIRLDANADTEITLFADRTPVHHARGGRSGKHRAVQITGPVELQP